MKKYGYNVKVVNGEAIVVREPRATAQYICESNEDNKEAAVWAANYWNKYYREQG